MTLMIDSSVESVVVPESEDESVAQVNTRLHTQTDAAACVELSVSSGSAN